MTKLDKTPYYIYKLFGEGVSLISHLNNKNKDFISLETAFYRCDIPYDADAIKKKLLDTLEANNTRDFLNQYPKKYSDIFELIDEVHQDDYHLQFPDFDLLIQILAEEGYRLGILLLSQKGNRQKKNDIRFFSTPLDIMDIETAPIISFYHTFYNDEYILSNILMESSGDLTYDTTIRELYDQNPIHEKWIQMK